MTVSILFGIAFILAFAGVYKLRKTQLTQNGIGWVFVAFILVLCFQTFMAGIMTVVHIPVNIISIGITDLVFGILLLVLSGKKHYGSQKYSYSIQDFIIILCLLAFAGLMFARQFGTHLNISYITEDPANHYSFTLQLVETGKVSNLFYSQLTNALFIEFMEPVFSGMVRYKSFIIMEGIMYFVSGGCFLALIRQKDVSLKWKGLIPELLLMFLYVAAYPLNNMRFGYQYLGMGVTLIAVVIILVNSYLRGGFREFSIISLGLALCALAVCYSLFIPPVYVALFAVLIAKMQRSGKKDRVREWIIDNLVIFVIPCVMAIYYSFLGMFAGNFTSAGNTIATEGYIYRDIFGCAWIILVPCVAGVIIWFRDKKQNFIRTLFITFGITLVVLGVGALFGAFSTYYFFKSYYPMSLILFTMAYEGIYHWMKDCVRAVVAYTLIAAVLTGMAFGNFEGRIKAKNENMISFYTLSGIFDIYLFNQNCLSSRSMVNDELIEMCELALSEEKEGRTYACVGSYLDSFWFTVLTDNIGDLKLYAKQVYEPDVYWQELLEGKFTDIVIIRDSAQYLENTDRFDDCVTEFENSRCSWCIIRGGD